MEFRQLVFGTVQLGLPYGIANRTGRPSTEEAMRMLGSVARAGVFRFDTAKAYGDSETVLGEGIRRFFMSDSPLEVTTKLPHAALERGYAAIRAGLEDSLQKLALKSLFCVLLHDEKDIERLEGEISVILRTLKQEGLFFHIGCSVYNVESSLRALAHPLISVIQIPGSLLDRRFEQAGVFDIAAQAGKQVQVRSVLLQGLLCLKPDEIPYFLRVLKPSVKTFQAVCKEAELMPAAMALAWAARRWPAASILFGAESLAQVESNIRGFEQARALGRDVWEYLDSIRSPQLDSVLNPSRWEK